MRKISLLCKAILLPALLIISFAKIQAQSTWKAPAEANKLSSPYADKGAAAEMGKVYFNAICFVCHGNQGKGDGVNAAALERQPADLTSAKVQKQSDGAIFWKITEGNPPMLRFKETLSEEIRWQLVAYVRKLGKLYGKKKSSSSVSAKADKKEKSTATLASTDVSKNKTSKKVNPVSKKAPSKAIEVANVNPYKGMAGPDLFNNICGACHTIGLGKRIGPDLRNVQDRHPKEWIYKWVRSSQSMVKAGDKEAVRLFKEFNEIPMPDQPLLSDNQIDEILNYIASESTDEALAAKKTAIEPVESISISTYMPTPPKPSNLIFYAVMLIIILGISAMMYLKME